MRWSAVVSSRAASVSVSPASKVMPSTRREDSVRAVPKAWHAAAADPARPLGWVSRSMCSAMAASARSRHNAPGGSGSSPGRNSRAGTCRAASPWVRRSWSTLRRTHANRPASSRVNLSGVHRTAAGFPVAPEVVRSAGRLGK